MDVIRHEDIRMNLASLLGTCCRKATLEDAIVRTRQEERRPIVSALYHVLGLAREGESWQTRHSTMLPIILAERVTILSRFWPREFNGV
jgi:hypothetical protein